VGKAALDGLDGVKKVTRGWHWGREINTVTYDSEVITPEEMVAALKAAGTYAGTVE
jgi:copper chaperone CopZ